MLIFYCNWLINSYRDTNGNVFFNEMLFCTIRAIYKTKIKASAFLYKKEKQTLKRIAKAASKASKGGFYETTRVRKK